MISEQKRDALVGEALILGMVMGAVLIHISLAAFLVALVFQLLGAYSLIQKAKSEKPKRHIDQWEALKGE